MAGLIDGRGNLSFTKWTGGYSIYLKFFSRNRNFLERVNRVFEPLQSGKIIKGVFSDGKQTYILYFSPLKSICLMRELESRLKYKQDEAAFLLDTYDTLFKKRSKLTTKIREARESKYQQFRQLKKLKKQHHEV